MVEWVFVVVIGVLLLSALMPDITIYRYRRPQKPLPPPIHYQSNKWATACGIRLDKFGDRPFPSDYYVDRRESVTCYWCLNSEEFHGISPNLRNEN